VVNLIHCNGRPADVEMLGAALVNYGHFTSLQVRGGAVQGLDLHLQRLDDGTRQLFGSTLDRAQVRAWMADALRAAAVTDATLRVTVFSRRFDFRDPLAPASPDVLVAVSAPVDLRASKRVRTVVWQRDSPALKHVGMFGLFAQRRDAVADGFDDVLLLTADHLLAEGSTWNIALHDGHQLIWPQAPALRGTAETLLQAGWAGEQRIRAVHHDELAGMQGALACNASGVWPLAAIDGQGLAGSASLAAQARAVMMHVPWTPLRQADS